MPADDPGKARDEPATSILLVVMAKNFCEKMTLTSQEAITTNDPWKSSSFRRRFCTTYQPIDSEQDCLTRQQISPDKAGWVTSDATKSSK